MYYDMYNLEKIKPDELIVYLRKSRSDDPLLSVEEVLSKHETILDEYCERTFQAKVPDINKYREVVSGETISDRPEFQQVLRLIESPRIKGIVVVEVQRLSRGDLEDAGKLMKLLRFTNTLIITPVKVYNLSDEYDRDAFERELKRGNEFLEYQKKIMNRGRLLSVQQGNFIASQPPYGYDKTWVMDGKRKCPTLVENKEQADIVRMIFDMYVNQDMGRTNICHKLDELGIQPPRGKNWSPAALKDMLENVHYIGKIRWNWRKTQTVVEDSELIQIRPKAKLGDYLIYDGKHEGIIPEELFIAARAKQGRNHRAKAKTKVRNPLAGLVFCQCGRTMSYRTYMKNGVERSPARLLCDNQSICGTSSALYDEILEKVKKLLKDSIQEFELELQKDNRELELLHRKHIRRLEDKLEELEQKEISQWEKYSEESMPKHIFDKLNKKVLQEIEETKLALKNTYETMPEPIDYRERICRFSDALDALCNPDICAETKNKLLKSCIDRIDYKREKAERVRAKSKKRVTINGKRVKTNGLSCGSTWTAPEIMLDVHLRL